MTSSLDARLPVYFVGRSEAPIDAAVLAEEGMDVPSRRPTEWFRATALGHPPGCACCGPRSPAAQALSRLFVARARGTLPFFSSILVIAGRDGECAVRDALTRDPAVAAWFRLAEPSPTASAEESIPGRK